MSNDKKQANTYPDKARYEVFKLLWMAQHGYTVKDLVTSVLSYRAGLAEDMADDPRALAELDASVLADWEMDCGFDGSIWPCLDEFLDCDDPILQKDGTFDDFSAGLEILKSKLPVADDVAEDDAENDAEPAAPVSPVNPQLPKGMDGVFVKDGLVRIDLTYGVMLWPALAKEGWKIAHTNDTIPYADYVQLKQIAAKRGFHVLCDGPEFVSGSRASESIRVQRTCYVPAEHLLEMDFVGLCSAVWVDLMGGEKAAEMQDPNGFRFDEGDCCVGEKFDAADPDSVLTAEQVKAHSLKTGKCLFDSHGNYEHGKYDGKTCTVIRPLTEKEVDIFDVGQMYCVSFKDGAQHSVFGDELTVLENNI